MTDTWRTCALTIGFLAGFSVLGDLPPPAEADTGNAAGGPVVVVGHSTISLGEIPPYGITNRTFRLRNTSDQAVKIERLVSTCSCIKGTFSTNEIPPQGELSITASLNAALVHGAFRRGLWVRFTDPQVRAVGLSLTGITSTLFSGFPDDTLVITGVEPGLAVTNQFTLTALTTNATLGIPAVECADGVTLTYSLTTNRSDKTVYSLTTVLSAKGPLPRQSASLTFPVAGTASAANPMVIRFRLLTADALLTIPNQITLDPNAKQNQTVRLLLRSRTESLEAEHLTWDPLPEGVTFACSKVGRRKLSIAVSVTVTPQAAAALLKDEQNPHLLHFRYPKHKETTVSVVKIGTVPPAPTRVPLTQRLSASADDDDARETPEQANE